MMNVLAMHPADYARYVPETRTHTILLNPYLESGKVLELSGDDWTVEMVAQWLYDLHASIEAVRDEWK